MGKIGKLFLHCLYLIFLFFAIYSFVNLINVHNGLCMSITFEIVSVAICVLSAVLFYEFISRIKKMNGTRFLTYIAVEEIPFNIKGFIITTISIAGIFFLNHPIPLINIQLNHFLFDNILFNVLLSFFFLALLCCFLMISGFNLINLNFLLFIRRYKFYKMLNSENVQFYYITKRTIKNTMKKESAVCLFKNIYLDKS